MTKGYWDSKLTAILSMTDSAPGQSRGSRCWNGNGAPDAAATPGFTLVTGGTVRPRVSDYNCSHKFAASGTSMAINPAIDDHQVRCSEPSGQRNSGGTIAGV